MSPLKNVCLEQKTTLQKTKNKINDVEGQVCKRKKKKAQSDTQPDRKDWKTGSTLSHLLLEVRRSRTRFPSKQRTGHFK